MVAGITIFAKEGLYRATMRVARKHDHALLRANAVHHRTDALSSVAVFVGLFASMYGFSSGDLIAALVVGLLLIRAGLKIVWEAGLELSEAGVDAETYTTMRELILDTGGVEDLHLLKTKTVGGRIFAEAHVQVRPTLSVTQGHEIAHRAVDRVMEAMPLLQDLTVHVDPRTIKRMLHPYQTATRLNAPCTAHGRRRRESARGPDPPPAGASHDGGAGVFLESG